MSDIKQLCPFCIQNNLLKVNILYEDPLWYITDMQQGSINNATMAITKRHIKTPFEINEDEWASLRMLLNKMKKMVDAKEVPSGYNIGWNVHKTGGQNVAHAHLHLLARYDDEPLAGKGIKYAFKQSNNQRTSQSK